MLKCDAEYESVKFVIRTTLVAFYKIANGSIRTPYYNLAQHAFACEYNFIPIEALCKIA